MRSPDRFQSHPPMLLAGLRRTYGFGDAATGIPAAWAEFVRSLPLPGQVGDVTYGAVCAADMAAQTFEYMCAAQVDGFDALNPSQGRMRVPQAHYAVFVHAGPIHDIRATIVAAHDWLAHNGSWVDGQTPEFERYGPDFDPAGGGVEMWVPVTPA